MKHLKATVAVLWLVLLGMGCDKTTETETALPDDATTENTFVYQNNTYDASVGYLINYGTDSDGITNFDVFISSESITFSEAQADFLGTGNAVYFEMFSATATDIAPGNYTFVYTDIDANTFDWAELYIDYNIADDSLEPLATDNTSSGTVTVSKTGETYRISYEFTLANAEKVTGTFSGSMKKLDAQQKKPKK